VDGTELLAFAPSLNHKTIHRYITPLSTLLLSSSHLFLLCRYGLLWLLSSSSSSHPPVLYPVLCCE
jgi:hypothetical protein